MTETRAMPDGAVSGSGGLRSPRPPAGLLLTVALVAAAMMLPLAYLILRTFGAGTEAWDLVARPRTAHILFRSIALMLGVTAGSTAIAVPLAWLTVRTDIPWRRLWTILTVLPLVIPSYVGGLVVVAALGPKGMLQQFLSPLGVDRLPEIYGFPGAMLVLTLLSYPYILLSVRSALWGLDPALEDASRSLGRGAWTTFRRLTLPQLRPAIAGGALLVALYVLSDFGAVSLLKYETFTWAIYLQYESAFDRTLAATLSLLLVAVAFSLLLVEFRSRGRSRYYRATTGTVRPQSMVSLGRWRWPAVAFCGIVVFVALVIPVSVLSYWLARGVLAGEPLELVWGAAANSLYVSAIATAVAVAAALPVVFLAVRHPGKVSALLERASYIGFALPGLVVALALVFFGARYVPFLYQTRPLLVFAYVVLFLPAAMGAIRASLLQVSPRLEEAARALGRTPFQAFRSVTFPLVRSGVLAGGALVFLVAMKELPATLILSPIGFKTLATSVWSATSGAFFARAAAPALLLILVSLIPMTFVILRERSLRQ